jgi:enamine deaminase RidA (YjgF/YER057c/UK114 family)
VTPFGNPEATRLRDLEVIADLEAANGSALDSLDGDAKVVEAHVGHVGQAYDRARVQRVRDTGGFGETAGYSRAVRAGTHVAVSGTAALSDGRVQHAGDSYRQTQAAIRRALDAAAELGAQRDDVIRTRLLLAPDCDWREAARAHAEEFAGVEPANTTYYVARLIPEGALIEIELDASVGGHGFT